MTAHQLPNPRLPPIEVNSSITFVCSISRLIDCRPEPGDFYPSHQRFVDHTSKTEKTLARQPRHQSGKYRQVPQFLHLSLCPPANHNSSTERTLRIALAIALLPVLSACATVSGLQGQCESRHSSFEPMVACLRSALSTAGKTSDPRVVAYLATADDLVGELNAGRITEGSARKSLAAKYSELDKQGSSSRSKGSGNFERALDAAARGMEDYGRRPPSRAPQDSSTTDCVTDSYGTTRCTTRAGNTGPVKRTRCKTDGYGKTVCTTIEEPY